MIVLHEDFSPGAPLKSRDLNDDGTVTTVDANNVTAVAPATAASIARVARIQAAQTAATNADSLRAQLATQIAAGSPARNAVAGNTTFINGAKPGTAAAQASAAYDQAKALSQQNNVIIPTLLRSIRLLLRALDADS